MPSLGDLTVIIPLAPGEVAWKELIQDLSGLPLETEILFVGSEMPKDAPKIFSENLELAAGRKVRWIPSPLGRARQLNAGAKAARKPFLWFLHADSRFSEGTLPALENALQNKPEAFHYFNLWFMSDGPAWTLLNTVGTWIRAHGLGTPYGDQGFCMSRELFEKLGGYREDVKYGEDHLLVWKARQEGFKLSCTGEILLTSARKYREQGWAATTYRHGKLGYLQAFPEFFKLLRNRLVGSRKNK